MFLTLDRHWIFRADSRASEHGEQHCGQDRDDRDHNQQLDKGEPTSLAHHLSLASLRQDEHVPLQRLRCRFRVTSLLVDPPIGSRAPEPNYLRRHSGKDLSYRNRAGLVARSERSVIRERVHAIERGTSSRRAPQGRRQDTIGGFGSQARRPLRDFAAMLRGLAGGAEAVLYWISSWPRPVWPGVFHFER